MTKEQLLHLLLDNQDQYLSGQAIANHLSLSRNAIWKAIQSLKESGYAIESKKAHGYKLSSYSQQVDPLLIQYFLNDSWPTLNISYYDCVGSTNDLARLAIEKQPNQAHLIITSEQTEGRGRRGRVFQSDLKEGLYFSLAIQPVSNSLEDIPLYTLLTAAALIKNLQNYLDHELKVKWVNDLFYKGKKVVGILSEMVTHIENLDIPHIVIGIGINLAGDFKSASPDIQDIAGTLFGKQLNKNFNPNLFLADFLNSFSHFEDQFEKKSFLDLYKKHLLGLGQWIHFQYKAEEKQAKIIGMDEQGHLLVENKLGQKHTLYGQDIHFSSQQFIDDLQL